MSSRKPSSRYPSCGRAPSRRLHPELFLLSDSLAPNISAGNTKQIDNSLQTSSAKFVGATNDIPVAEQDDNDNTNKVETPSEDSDSDSSIVIPPCAPRQPIPAATMALSVQKFIAPQVFSAGPSEDAIDWLERYELAAGYNRWTDADRA